jgi:hypothetical protein
MISAVLALLAALAIAVPAPAIRQEPCPDGGGTCYQAAVDTVYLDPALDPGIRSEVRWHELGHAADHAFLDDGERHAFSCLPAVRHCDQRWEADHVDEVFAEAYWTCKKRLGPHDIGFQVSVDATHPGYNPRSNNRHAGACRFLARALSD